MCIFWNPQIQVSTNMSIVAKPRKLCAHKLNDFTVIKHQYTHIIHLCKYYIRTNIEQLFLFQIIKRARQTHLWEKYLEGNKPWNTVVADTVEAMKVGQGCFSRSKVTVKVLTGEC